MNTLDRYQSYRDQVTGERWSAVKSRIHVSYPSRMPEYGIRIHQKRAKDSHSPKWAAQSKVDALAGLAAAFAKRRPDVVSALQELYGLQAGWNGPGSGGLNIRTAQLASLFLISILTLMPNVPDPSIIPLNDGRVQIEWHGFPRELEIEFMADDSLSIVGIQQSAGGPQFLTASIPFGDAANLMSAAEFVKWLVNQNESPWPLIQS